MEVGQQSKFMHKIMINNKNIIFSDQSIKQALKMLKNNGEKSLIVSSKSNKLLGTISDGDIRSAILNQIPIESSINKFFKRKCVYFYENKYNKSEIKKIFIEERIGLIPIINKKKLITDVISWERIFFNKKKIKEINANVIIMAGGKGSRLEPFTEILPKPLIPINGKTVIEIIIEKFNNYKINSFFLSVNYKYQIIKAYLNEKNLKSKINYLRENNSLGTAGPLSLLSKKSKKTLIVSNCDIIIDEDYGKIYDFHKNKLNDLTLVVTNKKFKIPYGICFVNKKGNLKKITEKPEYDYLVNTGLYFLEPKVLSVIPKNQLYNFNDFLNNCIKKKFKIGVFPIQDYLWNDVGQWQEYINFLKKIDIKK